MLCRGSKHRCFQRDKVLRRKVGFRDTLLLSLIADCAHSAAMFKKAREFAEFRMTAWRQTRLAGSCLLLRRRVITSTKRQWPIPPQDRCFSTRLTALLPLLTSRKKVYMFFCGGGGVGELAPPSPSLGWLEVASGKAHQVCRVQDDSMAPDKLPCPVHSVKPSRQFRMTAWRQTSFLVQCALSSLAGSCLLLRRRVITSTKRQWPRPFLLQDRCFSTSTSPPI